MASTSILIFLLLSSSVMISYADWTLYVRLNSYSNPRRVYGTTTLGQNRYCCCSCPSTCCSSNVNSLNCNSGGCNTRILICANQGSTAKSCVYSNIINSDTVNFGQGNVAGGLTNPVQVTIAGPLLNSNVQVNMEVLDDNGVSSTANPSRILNTQANLQSPQVSGTFSSDTTVNEGVSNVISLSYATRIECATNYYQSNCSVYCIPTNDNTGHYTCDTNGNKICLPGYTNTSNNCLDGITTCREGCHPVGGYCDQPGQCLCYSGWSGTNCSVPDCPNECQNGACNVPNNCVCNDGWSGVNCTQPVCHQKCHSTGGQCTAPDTCTCNAKWTGGLCDVQTGGTGGGCVANTSTILSAIRNECTQCSNNNESWSLIGAIGTIINALLNVVLLLILLMISIIYFTCKTKEMI